MINKKLLAGTLGSSVLIAGLSMASLAFAIGANVDATAGATVNTGAGTAAVTATTKVDAKVETHISKIKKTADQEIDRRVIMLTALKARFSDMKKLSDTDKASLASTMDTQITSMNSIKSKIDADTDLDTLKTDAKSIIESYRVYMLIIPEGHIIAAADRLGTLASEMSDIEAKLEIRATEAQAAGKDVSKLQASLTTMKTKIADAQTQESAAQSTVAPLKPDNGDKAVVDSNHAALVSARSSVKVGAEDIRAAYKEVIAIRKALKAFGKLDASASASATTTTKAQ